MGIREERNHVNMVCMSQFQAQCDKAYQKAQRAVSERFAVLQHLEELKQKCSDLQAAVKVLHQAGKENRARATDYSKCLRKIQKLKFQLTIKKGEMCAFTIESGDSDPGVEWEELEGDAYTYAMTEPLMAGNPPPFQAALKSTSIPMNPVSTCRQDGQTLNLT
ncbi:hypothetical protein scyTo_0010885 [Scyliorhinus torazame]|uniref:Uncharacterized protein n=1 Tax=Scyliorhinus torazame TaxID=75743 RepID=A0A401PCT0_SCYTO|nr:hypothetical protein [Scyliorhinus torazame]